MFNTKLYASFEIWLSSKEQKGKMCFEIYLATTSFPVTAAGWAGGGVRPVAQRAS